MLEESDQDTIHVEYPKTKNYNLKQLKCNQCGEHFKTSRSLAKHENKHLSDGKSKSLGQALREEDVFECTPCNIRFKTIDCYTAHMKLTHRDLDQIFYMCEKCGKHFLTKPGLKNHIASKCESEKQYQCDECGQYYLTKVTLAAHKLIHTGEKYYCCSYCGKQFIRQGEVRVHERKHTKEKPFKCDICGRAFPYRESLVTHAYVHTGIKPFICQRCGKTFSCTGNLQKHRKTRPSSCGLPEYCQEKKRIVPRTRTKQPKKQNAENSGEEIDYDVEYLVEDDNSQDHSETIDGNTDDEKRLIRKDAQKTENCDENHSQIYFTDEQTVYKYKLESIEPVEEQTVYIDDTRYGEDFEQYGILMDEIEDNSNELSTTTLKIECDNEEVTLNVECDNEEETAYEPIDSLEDPLRADEQIKTNETDLNIPANSESHLETPNCFMIAETYLCPHCDFSISPIEYMIDHFVTTHNLSIEEVDDQFPGENELTCCKFCEKEFNYQDYLDKHVESHKRDQSDKVTEMKEKKPRTQLEKFQELQESTKIKTKDEVIAETYTNEFICSKCGKKIFSRSAFHEHQLSDCGTSLQYQCNICKKFYHSFGAYKRHESVHTGDKPYVCVQCDKSFRTKGQLSVHRRKHTGEKPFKCDLCPKSFPYRQSLITHITMHTGAKPFICQCGTNFSCIQNLLSHRRTFQNTCGQFPLNTKPTISIGVIKGQLYVGDKSE